MKNATIALACLVIAAAAHAQTASTNNSCRDKPLPPAAAALTYDVAVIRPHPAGDGSLSIDSRKDSTHIVYRNVSLPNIITNAFNIHDYQLSGGPPWMQSARFDIDAKSLEGDTIIASLSLCQQNLLKEQMLQALLVERLQLAFHRSAREVPGYNLVIAKGGPRLTKSVPASGDPPPPLGASMSTYSNRNGLKMTSRNLPIDEFTSWLSAEVRSPIADHTGLTGIYDIALQWSDELRASAAGESLYPNLFTAIQEQLGLKLEATRLPTETIVIDHIDHPSEN